MAAAAVACSDSAPTATNSNAPKATITSDSVEAVSAQTLALGAALYSQNCQSCHGDLQGNGNDGVSPLHNQHGHTFHHPDAQLMDFILRGKLPGFMPGFADRLTEQQIRMILEFIKTSWTPQDLKVQRDISRRYQEALDEQRSNQKQ